MGIHPWDQIRINWLLTFSEVYQSRAWLMLEEKTVFDLGFGSDRCVDAASRPESQIRWNYLAAVLKQNFGPQKTRPACPACLPLGNGSASFVAGMHERKSGYLDIIAISARLG